MVSSEGNGSALVLGMHRSGTSATALLLSRAGLALPRDLMPARPRNPLGFQESLGVVRLNDEVLEALGSAWDSVGPWLAAGCGPARSRERLAEWLIGDYAERAVRALEAGFPGGAGIVLKDPRICLLLPLWRAALRATGRVPCLVIAARHPLAVAASLHRRNAMECREAFWLWQSYMLGALAAGPEAEVVCYDALVDQPAAVLAKLCAALGLAVPPDADAWLREAIPAELRHHRAEEGDADAQALLPDQVKELWALLASWEQRSPAERAGAIAALQDRYDDAALLAQRGRVVPHLGRPVSPTPKPVSVPAPRPAETAPAAPAPAGRRLVVLHYHLFQSAGALLPQLLGRAFGAAHTTQEFPFSSQRSNVEEVAAHLAARPDLRALSSHSALLPVPILPGTEVFPVLFLRHPLLRLRAAYAFERRQKADTLGARLAKRTDLAGYVSELLRTQGSRQGRNFQCFRLAFGTPGDAAEEERAAATLARLPFVGLAEAAEASLARLETLLRPRWPEFRMAVGPDGLGDLERAAEIPAQLDLLRQELGAPLFERLRAANEADLRLHAGVAALYGVRLG